MKSKISKPINQPVDKKLTGNKPKDTRNYIYHNSELVTYNNIRLIKGE